MSYFLADKKGFVGDLATSAGLMALEKSGSKALRAFLKEGEADKALVEKIIEECDGEDDLDYIAKLMRKAKPPVVLTNGVIAD